MNGWILKFLLVLKRPVLCLWMCLVLFVFDYRGILYRVICDSVFFGTVCGCIRKSLCTIFHGSQKQTKRGTFIHEKMTFLIPKEIFKSIKAFKSYKASKWTNFLGALFLSQSTNRCVNVSDVRNIRTEFPRQFSTKVASIGRKKCTKWAAACFSNLTPSNSKLLRPKSK